MSDSILNTLRREMNNSGQTRYRISMETGISQNTLGRFATGKVALSGEKIETLARHLGLILVRKPGRKARKEK